MKLKHYIMLITAALFLYLSIPSSIVPPVQDMNANSYNHTTFWHPWGDHNHRGVDIFAKRGAEVHPATNGIVLWAGKNEHGGNAVFILSKGLRVHYYAHLDSIETTSGSFVTTDCIIGYVGDSGNAKGKPCHLHYSVSSIIPTKDCHFDKKYKLFFINPIPLLNKEFGV